VCVYIYMCVCVCVCVKTTSRNSRTHVILNNFNRIGTIPAN